MKQKYFSSYQSTADSQFQQIEKSKEYEKYLRRIEQIVHKRPQQDLSPMKYIKAQRQYKESVHKLARQELEQEIDAANQILNDRIASHMNRKPERHQKYELIGDVRRRRELERINSENQGIADRLAERYAHRKKKSALEAGRFTPKLQQRTKKSPDHQRLPQLVPVSSVGSLHNNM